MNTIAHHLRKRALSKLKEINELLKAPKYSGCSSNIDLSKHSSLSAIVAEVKGVSPAMLITKARKMAGQ